MPVTHYVAAKLVYGSLKRVFLKALSPTIEVSPLIGLIYQFGFKHRSCFEQALFLPVFNVATRIQVLWLLKM